MRENLKNTKEYKFEAIGTTWYLEFFQETPEDILEKSLNLVNAFEKQYSRFIPTSEISRLNRNKELKNPSKDLQEMLLIAQDTKRTTKGAFDISIGGILEDSGYDAKRTFKPAKKKLHKTGEVKFNSEIVKIGKVTKIDLGGLGKGFLVDKLKELFLKNGVNNFLINAGGDIYLPGANNEEIEFGLENPFNISELIGTIKLKKGAIASSSNAKRKWTFENKEYSHLISLPERIIRESRSVGKKIKAVYTYGKKCVDADLASTALFVSNPDLHREISKFFNIEYLIVFEDQTFKISENYPGHLY